jgi:hypothetical protein
MDNDPRAIMKAKKANRRTLKVKKGVKAAKTATRKKKSMTPHQYTEIGLQDLAILLFGEEAVREVKKKMDVREIWNLSTNITQCNNVIGVVKEDTDCWICGLGIDPTDPGMSPECEHILPVAQAVIYLSLYSAKKKNNTSAERRVRKLEYGWAHSVCNQDKSDICCIVNSGNKAEVNNKNITFILKKIYNSNRANSVKLKRKLKEPYPDLNRFINERLGPVKKRYQDIVNFLNPSSGENRFKLTILAGLVTAMDYRNIREEAQPLLNPDFLKQREEQKEELKELLNDTIKQDIGQSLGFLDLETLATAAKVLTSTEDVYNIYKKYYTTKENLDQLVEPIDNTLESVIFKNEKSLALGHLAKFYPQLYVRLAFMFIEPVTKSYLKPKIESNCIMCLGSYLALRYFSELDTYITKTKNIRESTKEKFTDKVSKILDKLKKEMDKNFPGIYEYIDAYYEKKIDATSNSL